PSSSNRRTRFQPTRPPPDVHADGQTVTAWPHARLPSRYSVPCSKVREVHPPRGTRERAPLTLELYPTRQRGQPASSPVSGLGKRIAPACIDTAVCAGPITKTAGEKSETASMSP